MNIEKEREAFDDWLNLGQTEVEPDELNEQEVNFAWEAWKARAALDTNQQGHPCRIVRANLNDGVFTLKMSGTDFSFSAGPKLLCDAQ